MIIKRFLLLNSTPDAGGTGTVDRGDFLPEDNPTPPAPDVSKDPEVKKLEDELAGKGDEDGEVDGDDKDGEVDDADDSAKAEKPGKKDSRIPASRHKEILEKERAKTAALAAEIAQLKQRRSAEDTAVTATAELKTLEADVERMEAEYAALLSDGETKQAVAVMAKIRQAERQMAEVKSDLKIQAATIQLTENARYETALNRIEAAYPVLNPDHEAYDEKMEARVARLSRANQAGGMTPTAALQDAVETILGSETAAQEKATTVTPRVTAKDVAAERKAAAVAKTVKAVDATPPLAAVGTASDSMGGGKLDAAAAIKLSQAQFAKLGEADLAALRGDVL